MLKGCMEFGIQIRTKSMQKEELREHYSWFYICKKKVGCMSKYWVISYCVKQVFGQTVKKWAFGCKDTNIGTFAIFDIVF